MAYVLTALAVGTIGLLLTYIKARYHERTSSRQYGCMPPPKRASRDPFFGLDTKWQDIRTNQDAKALPAGEQLFRQYGPTYRDTSILGTLLHTTQEENIQAVFGTKSKDWGVKPFRYEGMRPFCGEGMLSSDGHLWERSRALFKPSFHISKISNLAAFELSLDLLLDRIPKDGSTVELDKLLSTLFVDTSTHFILGEPLGLLDGRQDKSAPVSGETFLQHFQLSLRGVGIRIFLGPLRAALPKSLTVDHWNVVHQFVDCHVAEEIKHGADGMTPKTGSLLLEYADTPIPN